MNKLVFFGAFLALVATVTCKPWDGSLAFSFPGSDLIDQAKAVKNCIVEKSKQDDAATSVPQCILDLFGVTQEEAKKKLNEWIAHAGTEVQQYFEKAGGIAKEYYNAAKARVEEMKGEWKETVQNVKDWIVNTIG